MKPRRTDTPKLLPQRSFDERAAIIAAEGSLDADDERLVMRAFELLKAQGARINRQTLRFATPLGVDKFSRALDRIVQRGGLVITRVGMEKFISDGMPDGR